MRADSAAMPSTRILFDFDHRLHRRDDIEIDVDVAAGERHRALAAAAERHVDDIEPGLLHEGCREDVSRAAGIDADPQRAGILRAHISTGRASVSQSRVVGTAIGRRIDVDRVQ